MKDSIEELKELFPPFKLLPTEALKRIQVHLKYFTYNKKQLIYREGFTPSGLFIIKKGKVKLYKITDSMKEVILLISKEKEMVGFNALLRNSDYHFWAEAIEETDLICIPRKLFFELIDEFPQFNIRLMKLFFKDFDFIIRKMVDMVADHVRKKTAKTLLYLIQTHGLEPDGKTINISLSRQDLANLVATNTETLVRTISEFKQEKIIGLRGKKIEIRNFEKLNKIIALP